MDFYSNSVFFINSTRITSFLSSHSNTSVAKHDISVVQNAYVIQNTYYCLDPEWNPVKVFIKILKTYKKRMLSGKNNHILVQIIK